MEVLKVSGVHGEALSDAYEKYSVQEGRAAPVAGGDSSQQDKDCHSMTCHPAATKGDAYERSGPDHV